MPEALPDLMQVLTELREASKDVTSMLLMGFLLLPESDVFALPVELLQ